MDALRQEMAAIAEANDESAAKEEESKNEATEALVAEARASGERLLEEERARHDEAVNTEELKPH